MRQAWYLVRDSVNEFLEDDVMAHGAALAFYTALSLAPLLILLIWVTSLLGSSTQDQIVQQIHQAVGPRAGEAVNMIIENASAQRSWGTISAWLGFGMLIISATGVFAQMQASLNRIWDVKAKPGLGIMGYVRKRLLSLGMILVIFFLLLVSMVLSAVLSAIFTGEGVVWQVVNFVVSLLVYAALFAFIYKYLPDVEIHMRDVLIGAVFTAVLFSVGKWGIGMYLGHSSAGSAYGAAGSLVVMLLWVYYSSLIVFFGAELTQVWARRHGQGMVPDEHAMRIEDCDKPAADDANAGDRRAGDQTTDDQSAAA